MTRLAGHGPHVQHWVLVEDRGGRGERFAFDTAAEVEAFAEGVTSRLEKGESVRRWRGTQEDVQPAKDV